MDRRKALQLVAGASAFGVASAVSAPVAPAVAQTIAPPGFGLPPLGYSFEALEPHIDAETMRIHYGVHHRAYVDNLNAIVKEYPMLAGIAMARTLRTVDGLPYEIQAGVRNNMGGHWNHSFFWKLMTPGGPKGPQGRLAVSIAETFGGVPEMEQAVAKAALSNFGSGWVWLGVGLGGHLMVLSTADEETPHMVAGVRGAVLGIDLWEHAYYLRHRNARAAYVKAWWNVVNWDHASDAFEQLLS